MRNPVIALVWETWRLSRRWYLWALPVVAAIDFAIMSRAEALAERLPGAELAVLRTQVAMPTFFINFSIAIFATLLSMMMGNRAGFPLAFEFRLPVRTPLLVAVPMATLVALCTSLYLLPMLVCRLLYGVPFPLLASMALIGTLVVILLACCWSTTSTGGRSFAMIFGLINAVQLFAIFDAVHPSRMNARPGRLPTFDPTIVELTTAQYLTLGVICVGLFALAAATVGKQRCGESARLQLPGTGFTPPRADRPKPAVIERMLDSITFQCPVSSPWRAELWLELRRQVLPVVLLGLLVALAVPLLFALGIAPGPRFRSADYLLPAIVFFGGIGIAVFNRRQASAGYMSAFEGTRGMSTLTLASIQVLSVAFASLLGMALVCVSVYFTSTLLAEPGELALWLTQVVAAPGRMSPLLLLSGVFAQLVVYLSAVALLTCIHSWSVLWGRVAAYTAGIVSIYGAVFAARVQSGNATFDDIKQHLWGFAIAVFVIAVLALARTLYTKVLSLRAGAVAVMLWAGFVACRLYVTAQQDSSFRELAPEMQAFQGALLVSPLLLFVLLLWSYDRLRHR